MTATSLSRPVTAASAPSWVGRYQRRLVAGDALVVCAVVVGSYGGRFGWRPPVMAGVPYHLVGLVIAAAWLLCLHQTRSYDGRMLGYGIDEYRRVANGSLYLAAFVGITCYVLDLPLARGFVALACPVGTAALLGWRCAARTWLRRLRARDASWSHRVLVVGTEFRVTHLIRELRREAQAGYAVAGVCLSDGYDDALPSLPDVPVLGTVDDVRRAVTRAGADTVAATGLTIPRMRALAWELEDMGVNLIVAPALTDVTGPRIHTRPVGGLPLLHVEAPELAGPRRTAKDLLERAVAALAVLALLPVLAVVALAVRLDSPGPAIFRQTRVGLGGRRFTVYKFRSMVVDAEAALADLAARNEKDAVLFKIRHDPRVTRVGRFIRKWSLDELPQLFNVVRGDMSLVGPRPPLPSEVARYGRDAARRLLVRPGITGLWQVSGRSDLTWEDSVRLDLYYVENWSFTADLVILWKTIGAVLRRDGAY
ncbi:sugar transferase [Sphaerisporangium sp. NPDC051011]|uniref:sugar transferase n=1 Tax=Sphaerisporangium sp. NPDC051011 TaxID=3155792 RepID=UPI0033E5147E